ncbi:MAG: hypothetical protein RLZZ273_1517 [Bacteroidota bacterium]
MSVGLAEDDTMCDVWRMTRSLRSFLVFASAMFVVACGGLDPEIVRPFSGLRGTITYVGGPAAWPTDTIYDLRVVAFEKKPTERNQVLLALAAQTAAYSPMMLPVRVDSTPYVLEVLLTPRSFEYVVVAMQNGPDFLKDWLMLDVYSKSGDPADPTRIIVPSGGTVPVDFTVDFSNLPPQPFP